MDGRRYTILQKKGSYELVKAVADMGIDINLQTNEGKNCLHIAAEYGYFNLCWTLIRKHNVDMQLPDHERLTALHYFGRKGSYELVKAVADMGTDINLETNEGKNCLHISAEEGHMNLCRMLICKHNSDVHLPDHDGWTALHYFAQIGSYELVKNVADMAIGINIKTNDGKNYLHIAAENSHFNLCWMLIRKHNFEVHLPDHDG